MSVCYLSQMNALLFESCIYSSVRFLYLSELYTCSGSEKHPASISFIGFQHGGALVGSLKRYEVLLK